MECCVTASLFCIKYLRQARKALRQPETTKLCTCVGHPKGSSSVGIVAEARCVPFEVISQQETLRVHLRHRVHARNHFLSRVPSKCSSSGFAQTIHSIPLSVPTQRSPITPPHFPPGNIAPRQTECGIPVIVPKKTVPQSEIFHIVLDYMYRAHSASTFIFTDGSSTMQSSSSGQYIPQTGEMLSFLLE